MEFVATLQHMDQMAVPATPTMIGIVFLAIIVSTAAKIHVIFYR